MNHSERAHSSFAASAAERWLNCPGSVALSEGLPDRPTPWSIEGTKAHEVLEKMVIASRYNLKTEDIKSVPIEMLRHARKATEWLLKEIEKVGGKTKDNFRVERRVFLSFISDDVFGTLDYTIFEFYGTLHIIDFKYGMSLVSPIKNLQLLFYGCGLAHEFDWEFEDVKLTIIQPRAQVAGPVSWTTSIDDLKEYGKLFKRGVMKIKQGDNTLREGDWCYWCKAKGMCPLKNASRTEKAQKAFGPITDIKTKKVDFEFDF